jgi:hypothetical protein
MSEPSVSSHEVPVDVLPPLPHDATDIRSTDEVHPATLPPLAGLKTFFHPASGLAILGIDILCFGPQVIFPFDVPVMCVLAFLATFPFVYFFQLKWSQDRPAAAFGKAFFGAFMAGLPFSIAGTLFGAAILALAGLPRNPVEAYKKITSHGLKLTP